MPPYFGGEGKARGHSLPGGVPTWRVCFSMRARSMRRSPASDSTGGWGGMECAIAECMPGSRDAIFRHKTFSHDRGSVPMMASSFGLPSCRLYHAGIKSSIPLGGRFAVGVGWWGREYHLTWRRVITFTNAPEPESNSPTCGKSPGGVLPDAPCNLA